MKTYSSFDEMFNANNTNAFVGVHNSVREIPIKTRRDFDSRGEEEYMYTIEADDDTLASLFDVRFNSFRDYARSITSIDGNFSLLLERTFSERGKVRPSITVDDIKQLSHKCVEFLKNYAETHGRPGWVSYEPHEYEDGDMCFVIRDFRLSELKDLVEELDKWTQNACASLA